MRLRAPPPGVFFVSVRHMISHPSSPFRQSGVRSWRRWPLNSAFLLRARPRLSACFAKRSAGLKEPNLGYGADVGETCRDCEVVRMEGPSSLHGIISSHLPAVMDTLEQRL